MRRWCCCTGIVFLLVSGGVAQAQPSADQLLAKRHYQLGAQLYKTSDYTRALAEFQEAYRLSKKPGLLFNLARCHEVLANLEQSIKYYRMYLAQVPGTSKRSLVQSRLRNLEKRLAAQKPKQAPDSPGAPQPVKVKEPVKPIPATPPAAPEPSEPAEMAGAGAVDTGPSPASIRRWKRTAGWIALGTGGALLVTGIVFGAMASGKAADYEEAARDQTYDDLSDLREEGESLQSTQIGLMVAGGVLAAAGGGLLLWHYMGKKKDEADSAAMVAPMITESCVGLLGRLRF